jgi:hypothetical protein
MPRRHQPYPATNPRFPLLMTLLNIQKEHETVRVAHFVELVTSP